jgi:flavorubredoxin
LKPNQNQIGDRENSAMSNVLVIFQADTEHTEQMALAIAVGAVEAQASIRLRRLAASGAVEVAHKGYGKLQASDLLWADTIVVGLESPIPKSEELDALFTTLGAINPDQLKGKKAWTFNPELAPTQAQILVKSALSAAGIDHKIEISTAGTDDERISKLKEAGRQLAGKIN